MPKPAVAPACAASAAALACIKMASFELACLKVETASREAVRRIQEIHIQCSAPYHYRLIEDRGQVRIYVDGGLQYVFDLPNGDCA